MSILVCFHTAPYYIPGILCWEIFWVCNSPWAIGHVTRQVTNWGSSLQPLEVPLSLKQYTVFLDGENEWQHQFIDESISPSDDMVESTRLIMFHDCDPPPRYYTKASSHCWIPYVWCQNPHLWSAKKLSNYPTTTFCLLKHGKTLRFFPFLHVFFVRILRHPAWRKATRHTLNKAQLTANKGKARTLLQGTTITLVSLVSWENFVVSRCLKYLLFFWGFYLFVYMHGYVQTLFDFLHSKSFGWFNRIIIPAHVMEKKGNFPLHDYQSIVVVH